MAQKEKLNILHLVSTKKWTGVADPALILARYQKVLGHKVWFAAKGGSSFEKRIRQCDVEYYDGLDFNTNFNLLSMYGDYKNLKDFIIKNDIDVIHTHLSHEEILASLVCGRINKKVLLVRGYYRHEKPQRAFFKKLFLKDHVNMIITPTKATKELFNSGFHYNDNKIKILSGAVDLDRFHANADRMIIRKELNIPENAIVVGLVSRMRECKGYHWLLEAMPKVFSKMPDVKFLLIGKGGFKKTLEKIVAEKGWEKNVIFGGYRNEDLTETYAAFDMSMFLALGSEASCRTVLEAMACGRPVIAVNEGPVFEVVEDGKNGIIVEKDNADSLANAILTLATYKAKREEYGKAGKAMAETTFHPLTRAKKSIDLYLSGLSELRK